MNTYWVWIRDARGYAVQVTISARDQHSATMQAQAQYGASLISAFAVPS